MDANNKAVDYNVPQSVRQTLKNGEYAVYQLIDVHYDSLGKLHGRTAGIPNRDVLMINSEPKAIGFVDGYNPDGSQRLGNIWFHIDSECTVLCQSGVKHANMYAFLESSNFNESNPHRDHNIVPVYRRVDSLNQAKQTREQRNIVNRLLTAAMAMSDEEVLQFINVNSKVIPVRIVGLPDGKIDHDAVRDGFERWIEKNPKVFEALSPTESGSSDDVIRGMVEKARKDKVIGFDNETKSWYSADGKPIFKVTSTQLGRHISEFLSWLKSPAGAKILKRLQDQ